MAFFIGAGGKFAAPLGPAGLGIAALCGAAVIVIAASSRKSSNRNYVPSSDTNERKVEEKKKEANRKFDNRRELNLISGGSYKRVYENFQPTAGILEVNHFVASHAYGGTIYSGISRIDQPCVVMRIGHHRSLCTTIARWYRDIQADFMRQGNFYMALRVEVIAFFKSGILNVYADDIIQMLEYLLNTDIRNAPGRLINRDQFVKLVKLIKKNQDKEPESTSSEYADLYDNDFDRA